MKKSLTFLFPSFPFMVFAQNSGYEIKSLMEKGMKAPNTNHIGKACLNFIIGEKDSLDYNITQATFSANTTLDWHKHTTPQVLIIIEGEGYYQERTKEPIVLKKGDVIKCGKDTGHWHTSSIDSKVSNTAIYRSSSTVWTEKLKKEYYADVALKFKQD